VSTDGAVGRRMHALMEELFPICRSITGDGVRQTLASIGQRIPLEVHEVPSGTQVLDWTVPDEWNIRDAYVAATGGERVIDFRASNLHIVNYSEPVHATMSLEELKPHLHTHADRAEWVPYRTSYYTRTWGFCLSQAALKSLADGEYDIRIDSTLEPGSLTYGECVLRGERADEILITTHVCHPSLANDNLSGIALLTELGVAIAALPRRFTYRLLFVPGTIGSITWLARNEGALDAVVGGLVVACVGDSAPIHYKRSRRGDSPIDRAAAYATWLRGGSIGDFVPWGWDERQFNSPGFDLGVGCLSRSREGEYAEYHSSADDLDLVRPEQLQDALDTTLEILDVLEANRTYVNLAPKGEPQLGRRGLYPATGGETAREEQLAMLWVLNQSDGTASVLDVAERSGLSFRVISEAAIRLKGAGLLADLGEAAR
jgi:aminopeptidase-like protein